MKNLLCPRRCRRRQALAVAAIGLLPLLAAAGGGPIVSPRLSLNSGMVGIADQPQTPGRYGIEYRHRPLGRYRLIPSVGYSRAASGATYTYVDLKRDFPLSGRWRLTPSFGPGYFSKGRSLELGNRLEFRSGVELGYRAARDFQFAIAIYHISNGGLSEKNPGTEGLALHLLIPLR